MGIFGMNVQKVFQEAVTCFFAKDYEKAAKLFQKVADKGEPEAQFMLGKLYLGGMGVPKDFDKGVELLRKAVEQGHEKAKEELKKLGL